MTDDVADPAKTTGGIDDHLARLYRALTYPLLSTPQTGLALVVTAGTYALLIGSADPSAAAAAVDASIGTFDDLLVEFTVGLYVSAGWLGVALTILYAMLSGIAIVVVSGSIRESRNGVGDEDRSSIGSLVGVTPGVLAAGCASCGAGFLSVVGLAGAYALVPFEGNLIRLLGIVVLLAALARTGDPRTCRV